MQPVSVKSMLVKKELLPYSDVFGSLDRGCSLTKLLYKKAIPEDPERVSLQMAFYTNANFNEGIEWLVEKIKEEGASGQKLHLTGVGGDKYWKVIEEKTGLKCEYIDEFASQTAGCHFLVKNFDDDDFCYPEEMPPAMPDATPPEWIVKLIEKEAAQYKQHAGKRLPAVFGFCGSATGINLLHEDSTMEILGGSMFGGKSMMGMSKLIIGTNNYNELMELAEKGDLGNIDTLSGEVVADHDKAQFKGMPKDLPIIPFGKASEDGADNFAREDKAAGIVDAMIISLIPQFTSACKLKAVPKVYIGGHLFTAKVARDAFYRASFMNFAMIGILKFRFVSNGHTGCIGAMLQTTEEAEKRRDNAKVE